jgi:hypothetical protein
VVIIWLAGFLLYSFVPTIAIWKIYRIANTQSKKASSEILGGNNRKNIADEIQIILRMNIGIVIVTLIIFLTWLVYSVFISKADPGQTIIPIADRMIQVSLLSQILCMVLSFSKLREVKKG